LKGANSACLSAERKWDQGIRFPLRGKGNRAKRALASELSIRERSPSAVIRIEGLPASKRNRQGELGEIEKVVQRGAGRRKGGRD